MLRSSQLSVSNSYSVPGGRLRHRSRVVLVTVVQGGREVDGFQASSPETLRAELSPLYAHLPERDAQVIFQGVEEESQLLGLRRIVRETDLADYSRALSFLSN